MSHERDLHGAISNLAGAVQPIDAPRSRDTLPEIAPEPPEIPAAPQLPSVPRIPSVSSLPLPPSIPTPPAAPPVVQRAQEALAQTSSAVSNARSIAQTAQNLAQGRGGASDVLSAVTSASALASPLAQRANTLPQGPAAAVAQVASSAQQVASVVESARSVAEAIERYANLGSTPASSPASSSPSSSSGPPPLPEVLYAFTSANDPDHAWNVQRVRVREALADNWEATVDLVADEVTSSPDGLLGAESTLEIHRGSLARRVVGVVRRLEDLGVANGHRVARVVMVPALWRLSLVRDARIFQNKTAVEVVTDVLKSRGLYSGRVDLELEGTYLRREYCVQYRETDLAFITRLLESEGVTWYFRHTEDGERLVLTDHARACEPVATLDGAAVPIAGAEAETLRVECARFFDWEHEQRPTSSTLRDFDWTRPSLDLTQTETGDDPDERPVYDYPAEMVITGYSDPSYQEDSRSAWARTRQQRHDATARLARARTNVTGLTPGMTFELTGHGRSELDQRYLVVSVEHEGVAPERLYETTQHDRDRTDRYHNTVTCVPVDMPYRPEARSRQPRVEGLQTATVTGPAGEEIYTDEHGRIKVQFHWDRQGRRDEKTSCWIRVLQPWGGAGWGFVFIPRVGMEVVVSFLEGNPDRPLVLGCAYNGEHRPPYPLPDEKTKSTIKTQSSPGGDGYNELRFEDAAGSEEVFIHAQKDMNEVVEHDHSTTVHRDQTNTVDRNHSESVGGNQSLSVTGDRSKTVTQNETTHVVKNRTENVDGDEKITVLKTRTEEVTGKETVTLHDVRETTIDKGDTLTVKTGDHKVEVKSGNDIHNVTGDKTDHVTAHYDVTADQRFKVTQGSVSLKFENVADLQAAGHKITLQNNSAKIEFDGNKLKLSAQDELSLVCGNASITLKKDGTVTVTGTQKVTVASTGSAVNVEPTGVSTNGPKITSAATGTHEISGAVVKIN